MNCFGGVCMEKSTVGTVIAVEKQWWLKVNVKPSRYGSMDGSVFPHIAKVKYVVGNQEFVKNKWINIGHPLPVVGDSVIVQYLDNNPKKSKILYKTM